MLSGSSNVVGAKANDVTTANHASSRRQVLIGAGFAMAGAAVERLRGITPANAQVLARPRRIDVHHHFIPPVHVAALREPSRQVTAVIPRWSLQMSLEEMEKSRIETSVLSIAQPGVLFGNDFATARKLARELNDYGARLVRDHPRKFGLFAVIAPPDVEGSLREIEYAFDTLKADGIALLTSYGEKYLGDPSFAPVYEELNRRKAVIYVHPTGPDCCKGLVPGILPGSIEIPTDTTRTIAHVVFSGTATRFPEIRWIFSHSGGTLPFLTGRFEQQQKVQKLPHLPDGPMPQFRKLYYELAQGTAGGQLAALLKMVGVGQLLYGTDFPYRDGAEVNSGISAWGFTPDDLRAIERETAMRLLPRLRT